MELLYTEDGRPKYVPSSGKVWEKIRWLTAQTGLTATTWYSLQGTGAPERNGNGVQISTAAAQSVSGGNAVAAGTVYVVPKTAYYNVKMGIFYGLTGAAAGAQSQVKLLVWPAAGSSSPVEKTGIPLPVFTGIGPFNQSFEELVHLSTGQVVQLLINTPAATSAGDLNSQIIIEEALAM